MPGRDLVISPQAAQELSEVAGREITPAQLEVLSRFLAPQGASLPELKNYLMVSAALDLDPLAGESLAIRFRQGEPVRQYTSVHGLTKQSASSGTWEGIVGPLFSADGADCFCSRCATGIPKAGETCQWSSTWLEKQPPPVCKVGVWKKGFRAPLWAVCNWHEWARPVPSKNGTWEKMPVHMLGKQTKRVAFRAAFPRESGSRFAEPVEGQVVQGEEEPLTQAQLRKLHTLAGKLGWDDERKHREAGVASLTELTIHQAGDLIDLWEDMLIDDVEDSSGHSGGSGDDPDETVVDPDAGEEEQPEGATAPAQEPEPPSPAPPPKQDYPNLQNLPPDLRMTLLRILEGDMGNAEELLARFCAARKLRTTAAMRDEDYAELRKRLSKIAGEQKEGSEQ